MKGKEFYGGDGGGISFFYDALFFLRGGGKRNKVRGVLTVDEELSVGKKHETVLP